MDGTATTLIWIWILASIGGFVAFYLYDNAAWKRRWWPPFVILNGLAVIVATVTLTPDDELGPVTFILVPVLAWANIRNTRFCDTCGRTVIMYWMFLRPDYCPSCGAPLDVR